MGVASVVLTADDRRFAKRWCRVLFDCILFGLAGASVGWFADVVESCHPDVATSQLWTAWGWLEGVNLVFLHQLIYLWNEHHDR